MPSSKTFPDWLESVHNKRTSFAESARTVKFCKSRIRHLSGPDNFPEKSNEVGRGGVLYWMSRDQRVQDNWAFLYAQRLALKFEVPLQVCFCLVPAYQADTLRHFKFMIGGLAEVEQECLSLNIPFHLLNAAEHGVNIEDVSSGCKFRWSDENALSNQTERIQTEFLYDENVATAVVNLVKSLNIGCLITDFCPLRAPRSWVKKVVQEMPTFIPFCEIDAHNIVPVWCGSDKREYSARTIRTKLFAQSSVYLTEFPPIIKHPYTSENTPNPPPIIDWETVLSKYVGDKSVKPVDWAIPGTQAGFNVLYKFIEKRLEKFDPHRSNVANPALSGLSPWLHFGQISPQRAVLEVVAVQKQYGRSADIFIEECFNRRELADNFCFYTPMYDSIQGAYEWARETLMKHATDKRDPAYTKLQMENAQTADDLWNAAQRQLVRKGKMHWFLRQYWAKKILEWCAEGPEAAIQIAVYLNDRYSLDGTDPNGYVGIMWAICGIHDQGWSERPIFGKIRYMNYKGASRKFSVPTFVARYPKNSVD
uniref:Deoxyribodipyrimidine photo-lyase n=2 Tax=Trichobilharzia regenti TaxID=157069 RepID=A0AA85JVK3_TRIRE|nr:unnamed protein product [Trichobilharzia regenti]